MAGKKSKRTGSKPGMDALGAHRSGPKRTIGRGPKRTDPPARGPTRAPPGAAKSVGKKGEAPGGTAQPDAKRGSEMGSAGARDSDARGSSGGGASPGDGRANPGGAAEPGLRELADRASRSLGKLFEDAKEKAGPAARKVGQFLEEQRIKAGPTARSAAETTKKVAIDLEGGIEEAFGKISEQARDLMSKGQHTRVRIKFRGRQLTELPIAVVAAAEAASLWWFGPLRLLLGHVVGKTVLDVEFVSNADAHVAEGRALLADGELEKALAAFDLALSMDRKCAAAWLGRGVALKLRGDKPAARLAFEKAEECEPHGESGREARRHLDNLGPR